MSSTAAPQPPGPSRRVGSRRARAPWWLLLFLLLGLLASWLIGKREHDDRGSGGPRELPIQTVALADPGQSRILRIAPPSPPRASESARAPRNDDAQSALYAATPSFGPISVAGVVIDEHGAVAAGLEVRLLRAWEASSGPGLPLRAHVETTLTDDEGRYAFHFEGDTGAYRVIVRDAARAFHTTPARELNPWTHRELAPLRIESAPTRRIRIQLDGGRPDSFGARLRIRPRPPAHILGPAPLRLDCDLLLPAWRVPGLDLAVPADGLVTLEGIGGGDWEAVVVAREHAPRRQALERGKDLNFQLQPSALIEIPFAGTGGDPLWAAARDEAEQSWLIPIDATGVLNLPRHWWAAKTTRLWRPGCPPLSRDDLGVRQEGLQTLPSMGRIRSRGIPPDNRRFELRYLAPPAGPRGEVIADQIEEIDRILGTGDSESRTLDRLVFPGHWRTRLRDESGSQSASQDVSIRAGEVTEIEIPELTAEGRRLDLSIVSLRDGTPLPGALVTLATSLQESGFGLPYERSLALTGEDGRSSLTGLPAGAIRLAIGAPSHLSQVVTIEIPEAASARLRQTIELTPAQAELRVLLRDEGGSPLRDIDALVIDRQGTITRASSGESGELLFLDLAAGPHALFVDSGAERLPLDDWSWLTRGSGAQVLTLEAQQRRESRWVLPRPRRYRLRLSLGQKGEDAPPSAVRLSLISHVKGLGPGLYPSYDLGRLEPGLYETPPLFPGRYEVLGVDATKFASVDLELPPRGNSLVSIPLDF
jgi:hypothetical protein